MIFFPRPAGPDFCTPASIWRELAPNRYEAAAGIPILSVLIGLGLAASGFGQPLAELEAAPISLSPWALPEYALSVPVLGFLTFTLIFFMGLFPRQSNGDGSFYQFLKTVPAELDEPRCT